jgi:hypothetical protein
MKKINIIGTIIILCMIVVVSCKKYEDKSLQRGVGDVPTISDVNPAIFDSKNLETTFVKFTVSLTPGVIASGGSILASSSDTLKRATVATITSFPATVTINAKDVAEKLGISLSSIANGDVFILEVLVTINGQTFRSNAIFNVAVACAYDKNLAIGSYHAFSAPDQWNAKGTVTLTASPSDPYTIYVKGLAEIDGAVEDKGPLVMHIDPLSYAVKVDKTIIASDFYGDTNETYAGSGTYSSCDGSYNMNFKISVDAGSYGTFPFTFTRN